MSSLHAAGGLLLHQVSSPSSLVVSLSRACCITTSTSVGSVYSVAIVPQVGGSRRVTHKSHSSPSSLKTSPSSLKTSLSSLKSSPFVRFVSVSSPSILGGKRGRAVMPKGSWLSKLGFGNGRSAQTDPYNSPAYGPDDDKPRPELQFATFGAGCFWGPELGFQRIAGVSKTEVGYTQGLLHNPTYGDVCEGDTGHVEVVRVQYDPAKCTFESLLDAFWARHDPTTVNRQGGDVGTQYRSGIYYYTPEQEKAAKESLEAHQAKINKKVVTEILPAKKFYRAEEYHQQYLSKGGRFGFRQSAEKGCKDPIRCYG